jgi:hypothetical protein
VGAHRRGPDRPITTSDAASSGALAPTRLSPRQAKGAPRFRRDCRVPGVSGIYPRAIQTDELDDYQQRPADGGALLLGQEKQSARRTVGDSSGPNPSGAEDVRGRGPPHDLRSPRRVAQPADATYRFLSRPCGRGVPHRAACAVVGAVAVSDFPRCAVVVPPTCGRVRSFLSYVFSALVRRTTATATSITCERRQSPATTQHSQTSCT